MFFFSFPHVFTHSKHVILVESLKKHSEILCFKCRKQKKNKKKIPSPPLVQISILQTPRNAFPAFVACPLPPWHIFFVNDTAQEVSRYNFNFPLYSPTNSSLCAHGQRQQEFHGEKPLRATNSIPLGGRSAVISLFFFFF